MFALSDSQLQALWDAADGLPPKKRVVFVERIVAWLEFRNGRFIERDLDDAVHLALRGLIPEPAA
jgi:hypothetical protein